MPRWKRGLQQITTQLFEQQALKAAVRPPSRNIALPEVSLDAGAGITSGWHVGAKTTESPDEPALSAHLQFCQAPWPVIRGADRCRMNRWWKAG